jgi:hypothetical protein
MGWCGKILRDGIHGCADLRGSVQAFDEFGGESLGGVSNAAQFVCSALAARAAHGRVSDRNVWCGHALQESFVDLSACGLASMYPASDWSVLCSGPSWKSARIRSH